MKKYLFQSFSFILLSSISINLYLKGLTRETFAKTYEMKLLEKEILQDIKKENQSYLEHLKKKEKRKKSIQKAASKYKESKKKRTLELEKMRNSYSQEKKKLNLKIKNKRISEEKKYQKKHQKRKKIHQTKQKEFSKKKELIKNLRALSEVP